MIAREALLTLADALEGIPVLGCLEGSPVAQAGVRYGDIVLSVNGQRTRNWQEYSDAKDLRQGGMGFVVFRNGVEIALDITFAAEPRDPTSILTECMAGRVLPVEDAEPSGLAS